jgi:CRP/FNR family transcriptional regulator, cyclic AMP receptor protein
MKQNNFNEKHHILASHYLFGRLSAVEIDSVLALAIEKHFFAGQVIFQKGEEGSSMMIVLKGSVKIGSISADGREIVLNIINQGEVFGEIALLDGKERSADATAIGDCKVLIIRRNDFIPYLQKHSKIAIEFLVLLCRKLRNTSIALEDIGLLNIDARLARLLLKMSAEESSDEAKVLLIGLKLSQGQIGNLIGATRESVNKQLRAWQDAGIIQREPGAISILRVSEFKMIAELA